MGIWSFLQVAMPIRQCEVIKHVFYFLLFLIDWPLLSHEMSVAIGMKSCRQTSPIVGSHCGSAKMWP